MAAATLTLELGIDIGDLDLTIQVGAPFSCSSFVQRLGRSGRRSGRSRMMFVNLLEESQKNPMDALPWDLLRSIAVIQLYLEDRWVEPFETKPKPFSLLVHQTLSVLMAEGDLLPSELARRVLTLPPFQGTVTQREYQELLRNMLDEGYLERMEDGSLIVGMRAEQMTNHYSFYAVFQEEEVYRVVSQDGEVGTLNNCPAEEEVFVLAGRSWRVLSIDEEHLVVHVTRANVSRIPAWTGSGGDIHPAVVARMRKVLKENTVYPYLQPGAAALLEQARKQAREAGIPEKGILPLGGSGVLVCPWTGTKITRTLARLLAGGWKEELMVHSVTGLRYYLQVYSARAPALYRDKRRLRARRQAGTKTGKPLPVTADMVLPRDLAPRVDKYDFMVPDELLRTAYLENQMDVAGALEVLQKI